MSTWETIRHQVAVAGRVTDSRTDNPLGGVDVTIISGPQTFLDLVSNRSLQHGDRWATLSERPDKTKTRADGHYHFMDLPNGDYTIEASWPTSGSRYGSDTHSFTITRQPDDTIDRVAADITLSPTTLMGTITEQGSADPILMAEVSIKGGPEHSFADSDGHYLLLGLEVGSRTVQVKTKNHQSASQTVTLSPAGSTRTVDFSLTPK